MKIEINENSVLINNTTFQFPFELDALVRVIGTYSCNERVSYEWNNIGIGCSIFEKNVGVNGLYIYFTPQPFSETSSSLYSGEYLIGGEHYQNRKKIEKEHIGRIEILNHYLSNGDLSVSLIQSIPVIPQIEDLDLYEVNISTIDYIDFKDFNFKLAVLEILMYCKKLIKPIFYLDEFAKRYKTRKINVFAEGETVILEARKYFESIKIDKKYSSEITELFQDDFVQIYSHIRPFGNMRDGLFNIASIEDIIHFPNLKCVTLFKEGNSEIKNALEKMGIKVEYS